MSDLTDAKSPHAKAKMHPDFTVTLCYHFEITNLKYLPTNEYFFGILNLYRIKQTVTKGCINQFMQLMIVLYLFLKIPSLKQAGFISWAGGKDFDFERLNSGD
jgi:hypothetical protein